MAKWQLIDLVGCPHMTRSLRPHISRNQIEQNKGKNVALFSLNKLLHHLCNVHVQQHATNSNSKSNANVATDKPRKDLIENVINESLLNNFIGPMITQNAETMFLGTVSCAPPHYQASLRTIQVLSRTLFIKVPCMHTPWSQMSLRNGINQRDNINGNRMDNGRDITHIRNRNGNEMGNTSSILSFQHFLSKWQSVLYKHMMIENNIQQQMNQYDHTQNTGNPKSSKISKDQKREKRQKQKQENQAPDTVNHCQSPIRNDANNITQDIEAFNLSLDDIGNELNSEMLDHQLQELRSNIPQNTMNGMSIGSVFQVDSQKDSQRNYQDMISPESSRNATNPTTLSTTKYQNEIKDGDHQMKHEISSLLDDILQPKQTVIPPFSSRHRAEDEPDFLKSKDLEELIQIADTPKHADCTGKMDEFDKMDDFRECKQQSKGTEEEELMALCQERKQEDNTVAHLEFANLRLQNCKLTEEVRKLKTQSKYSSIFADYDREIETLHKMMESIASAHQQCLVKNLQLKHEVTNYKMNGQKSGELKTVRVLQRTLRETTKKLHEKERALMKLTSSRRHTDIRNRVLLTSKDEYCEMSDLLTRRENELGKSYLAQAETQAMVDRLQLEVTELSHENNTLRGQTKSLENEVTTLRQICKRINDDIKQKNQIRRVSKKWAPRRSSVC